jgi:hypothetical protein
MAQAVYSVNAVGYVNTTVPKKQFAMISNPLNAPTNTVNALLGGQVPDTFQVYIYIPKAGYTNTLTYDAVLDNSFGPDGDKFTIVPGGGAFVRNPSTNDVTITFVGEVPQGPLKVDLFPGFQIVSSPVPQQDTPSKLGLTGEDGDAIYQWNLPENPNAYEVSAWDVLSEPPKFASSRTQQEPVIHVGEAFWLLKKNAGSWTRTFSVNP